MDRRKGARTIDEPVGKQSGQVPRHRDHATPDDATLNTATSQLRRRFELDAELEAAREPGFVADEPAEGIPTPRPRMPLSSIPRRVIDEGALLALPLDHRAGFVLAHVDGETSIRSLVDVCGMPQDELVDIVAKLLALRVIALG
ncbi:MAG: hypothetical protein KF764_27930 [Labilithrix sp.]|nr:hypothetical protein [Labilithrix sp.]